MLASIRHSQGHFYDSLQITKSRVSLDFRHMAAELYPLWNLVFVGRCVTVLHECRPTCEHGANQHGNSSHHL